MSRALLELCTLACGMLAAGLGAFGLVCVRPRPLPDGPRGEARRRARRSGLGVVDPALRRVADLFAALPLDRARASIEAWLVRGGDFLGLAPDELLALSTLGAGAGLLAGTMLSILGAPVAPSLGFAIGALVPWLALRRSIRQRTHGVVRALPGAIDLLALCMGAGLDFAAALALVVRSLGAPHAALADELSRVLDQLALGRTRAEALRTLAARLPIATLHELAFAVIQADQKGSALGPVLQAQAQMIRMRRSVAAEQAAARASVLLILPLMLLMGAILLLLFAPFAIDGMGL
jgi:tight adherence protein C